MDRNNTLLISLKKVFLVITAALFVFATFPIVQEVEAGSVQLVETEKVTEQAMEDSEEPLTQITYIASDAEDTEETEEAEEEPEQEVNEEEEESTEESPKPEYTVTDVSAVKYANQSSNVRSGPSTDYERIGSLALNQEVQITGQASTGWYRISYNGGEGFVSNSLLVDTPIVIEQPEEPSQPEQPQPEQPSQPEQPQQPKQLWEYSEDELVQYIVNSIITPDMDAFTRARVINDYLCRTMTYDDSYTHCSTYDALAYGTGVCQGYANAFWRLMNAAGVETDYVRGYGWSGREWGRHGWNRSLINGTYYYTDVTWNDSMGTSKYLLISFEEMEKDHREQSINPSNRIK